MSGVWGNKLKLSIFGESHGKGIGVVISGLPAGVMIDFDEVRREMKRRAPGQDNISTPRVEGDNFEVLSGILDDFTTGAPVCAIILNTNTISKDYSEMKSKFRPGHADFTASVKYNGFNDYRGGGHFSGRITAPLVFAGAVAKQVIASISPDVKIGAHILSIKNISDDSFDMSALSPEVLTSLIGKPFPVLNDFQGKEMRSVIEKASSNKDSVGGVIECGITGLKAGLGDPFFDSVESTLAHLLFSIPAVKGVEFGKGFEITKMNGSETNDEFYYENIANNITSIKTYTNNNGGINGGITNGMPIIFKVAIKPTASIGIEQKTVDSSTGSNCSIEVKGRHDPCIVHRAVPVIEAVAAIGLLDLML